MPVVGHMEVQKVGGSLGAEVRNIDLRSIDADSFAALNAALLQHCVLVVRGQSLSPESQIAFTMRWGRIHIYAEEGTVDGYPELVRITNPGKASIKTEVWHVDGGSDQRPPAIAVLAAVDLPEAGGDTMFANQYRAYETLSDRLKGVLNGLDGLYYSTRGERAQVAANPAVRVHPETGRRSLFLSPNHVRSFEGMTEAESIGLLSYLFEHSVSPEFVYRHRWVTGDVVIWDNRCTLHYAVHDYGDAPRVMHRTSVSGEPPSRTAVGA